MHPRRAIPIIIDYTRDTWRYDTPCAMEMARLLPTYVLSGRLIYAVYIVESMPDEWRGEAVYDFIEQLDELERIAV